VSYFAFQYLKTTKHPGMKKRQKLLVKKHYTLLKHYIWNKLDSSWDSGIVSHFVLRAYHYNIPKPFLQLEIQA
jgi:hypothetical protein